MLTVQKFIAAGMIGAGLFLAWGPWGLVVAGVLLLVL